MISVLKSTALVCLVFAFVLLNATMPAHASIKATHIQVSVEDGLSQSSISNILVDSRGFVWIGTANGVNIYDGYSVRTLKGPNGDFDKYGVYDIREDEQGLIWINLIGNGVYTYDVNTNNYQFILSRDPQSKDYGIVKTLTKEVAKSDWVITYKTVGVYDRVSQTYQQVLSLDKHLVGYDSIYTAVVMGDYLLLASRAGAFVYHYSSNQLEKFNFLTSDVISQYDFDKGEASKVYDFERMGDELYIGTNDGVFSMPVEQLSSFFEEGSSEVTVKLTVPSVGVWGFDKHEQTLYIASSSGLYSYDTSTKTSEFLLTISDLEDSISDKQIVDIEVAKDGQIWMGSSSGGAFLWNPSNDLIQNIGFERGDAQSLSSNSVYAIVQDESDPSLLWAGTDNGLNLIDMRTGLVERYLVQDQSKTNYTESNIIAIYQAGQQLFLATYAGIVVFDKSLRAIDNNYFDENINEWLKNDAGFGFVSDNQFWVTNEKGSGVIDLNTKEITLLPEIDDAIGLNEIWIILGFLPNHPNELFYSTNSALWTYNVETKAVVKRYGAKNINQADYAMIDSMVLDGNGMLWLAHVSVGLIGLDADTFEKKQFYNNANSSVNNNVYAVEADDDNKLWFSSVDGLYQLDLASHHLRQFGLSDGFPAIEFNGTASLTLKNGLMAYGSMKGLSIFDPIILSRKQIVEGYKTSFTQVSALSRTLDVPLFIKDGDTVSLNYDDVGIKVDASTFNFFHSKNVQFEYRLIGDKTVTFPLTNNNSITFASLASGQHTLEVRAKSPFTGEFSQPTKLYFSVSYAPWRSPVAVFIYAIIVIGLISYWLYNRHQNQLALLAAHEEVKYRENRLQLALSGSNSDVWDWVEGDNRIYASRYKSDLGLEVESAAIHFDNHINLIHPEDRDLYISKWQVFLHQAIDDESFESIYRLQHRDGRWLWYKDLGKIVSSNEAGKATRVTGSFTNITDSKAKEERAQHYGDAFKQTSDWVLILDEKLTKVTANKAMCEVFGWQDEEFDYDPQRLGLSEERIAFYSQILPEIVTKGHWRGEDIIRTPQGKKYHVLVNITMSRSKINNLNHFICVYTDITAQKSAESELRLLANYDHLTGLPNRSLLLERIEHAIENASRRENEISLFFIDLDRFKQVNDSLGHDHGDLLLKEITKRLTNSLRIDDTVARIGGDEFVVLLEHYKSVNHLSHIAQKIINEVEQPIQLNNNVVSVGASIGISIYPNDSSSSGELLRNADIAMYHAKQSGRNNFQFFTEKMNSEAQARLEKESNIKLALKNHEFSNVYQPLIDAHTGKAVGAEMLMRWHSPSGFVSPAEFIPLAEELGLIVPMTDIALEAGFAELKKWRQYRPDFYLSVNLSAAHFIDENLVKFITEKLEKYDLPTSSLKLEVTESALISDPEQAIEIMNTLKSLGILLALDDFGTGFSSLSYLKRLPLDIIKIDRSFINGIGIEPTDQAIVDATLVLAESLKMACIAEGVETKEQLKYLVDHKCHLIQGYFYHKPLNAEDMLVQLAEDKTEIIVDKTRSQAINHFFGK